MASLWRVRLYYGLDSGRRAPWLRPALCLLVLIVGWLLGHVARWFADGLAVNAQLYFHAFRIADLRSPWVLAPLRFLSGGVLQYSALASWAYACGYWCARGGRRTNAWVGAFSIVALFGTVFTTTSVRVAQPWFFEHVVAGAIHPMVVKVLFMIIPAWIATRAVRYRSTSAVAIAIVASIGIVLAWWHASDLGHALTFGCVVEISSRSAPCASVEMPWGIGIALVLTAMSGLMAWDAVAGKLLGHRSH